MEISGIQQMGVGIPRVQEAFDWYRNMFGVDIKVFEEAAEAGLMLPYTGGKPHDRHAILALSLQGGGGFEIWQYTSRTPEPASFQVELGDLGFNVTKIKSWDVKAARTHMKAHGADWCSELTETPSGTPCFYVRDPYGNHFQVIQASDWFKREKHPTGGVYGAIIGVSNLNKSMAFYRNVLGYDRVVSKSEGTMEDFSGMPGDNGAFKRAILQHSKPRKGAFSPLLGSSEIELVERTDRPGRKIYENRFWGDLGFIHLCFDVRGMDELQAKCETLGHPFTVDSASSFDMGEAAGRFSYIEDPDGALIEFVETHKVPIVKKWGWYIHLKNRAETKPLPSWLLRAFSFNRVKR